MKPKELYNFDDEAFALFQRLHAGDANPFNWRMRAGGSAFAGDRAFTAVGGFNSASASAQVERQRETNPTAGFIRGVSAKSEAHIEAVLRTRYHPVYTKAVPTKKGGE
jgi:hypothetical protein